MRVLLLTSEILVGGALFIIAAALGTVFTRRRLIAHGMPLTVCALRERGDQRWRFGLARYGTTGVEWFTLLGFSLRPARQWERGLLEVGVGQPLEPGERPEILIPAALRVECRYRQARFEIALAQPPYTALRSWLEAAPPGRGVNVA
ncbi:MAG: DUF2550 domain-containing protein [Dermatophilaceae bacterium]